MRENKKSKNVSYLLKNKNNWEQVIIKKIVKRKIQQRRKIHNRIALKLLNIIAHKITQ